MTTTARQKALPKLVGIALAAYRNRSRKHRSANWKSYAAAAGATVASAGTVDAVIVHVIPESPPTALVDSRGGWLSVDLDGVADERDIRIDNPLPNVDTQLGFGRTIVPIYPGSYSVSVRSQYSRFRTSFRTVAGSALLDGGSVARLQSGDLISSGQSFGGGELRAESRFESRRRFSTLLSDRTTSRTGARGQFGGGSGLIGVKFDRDGDDHFGWVRIEFALDENRDEVVRVLEWAYNDTANAPIQAGRVPEPAGLLLLATGAAGVMAIRRKYEGSRQDQAS